MGAPARVSAPTAGIAKTSAPKNAAAATSAPAAAHASTLAKKGALAAVDSPVAGWLRSGPRRATSVLQPPPRVGAIRAAFAGVTESDPMPTFSVVIPAYQAAQYVREAIDSVLAQTVGAHEIIVCDDGSTDGTAEVLATYGDRIRVLRQENRGPSSARNAACQAATGEYIALLDADDSWLPQRLERVSEVVRREPSAIVTTDAFVRRAGQHDARWYSDFVSPAFPADNAGQRQEILRRNFVFALTVFSRSHWLQVGGLDEKLRWSQDYDLWLRLIFAGHTVRLIDEPLATYRLHDENISGDRTSILQDDAMIVGRAPVCTNEEKALADRRLVELADSIQLARAQRAVLRGTNARRLCFSVALNRRQSRRQREKAALAALAPRLARLAKGLNAR